MSRISLRRESSSSPRFQSSSELEDKRSERKFARALLFPIVKEEEEAGKDRLSKSVAIEPRNSCLPLISALCGSSPFLPPIAARPQTRGPESPCPPARSRSYVPVQQGQQPAGVSIVEQSNPRHRVPPPLRCYDLRSYDSCC